jgi:hypothetical protein
MVLRGSSMIIGDHELPPDKALGILNEYAARYASTVQFYDLAGDPDGCPGPGSGAEPVNAVSLGDVGRLVVINAGLAADDVATIMNIDAASEFTAVPARARLEDCDPASDLYQASTALYEKYRLFRGSNIGRAKRSKLLHLKRPWLVPIADSRTISTYSRRAQAWAARLGTASGHWEAVREDLIAAADDFEWLAKRLSEDQRPELQRLGRLTRLRLLDILAWTLGDV